MGYMVEADKIMHIILFIEEHWSEYDSFCKVREEDSEKNFGYFMALTREQRRVERDLSEYMKMEKKKESQE